jgi:hypothetical protein
MTCLAGFIFVGYTNGVIEKVNIDTVTGIASETVCDLKGHFKDITCFAHQVRSVWSRAIMFLISGSLDESIRIWNAHTGECVNLVVETAAVVSLTVARNLLFCGLKKGGFHVWYPNVDDDFATLEEKLDEDRAHEIEVTADKRRQAARDRKEQAKAEKERIQTSLAMHMTKLKEEEDELIARIQSCPEGPIDV